MAFSRLWINTTNINLGFSSIATDVRLVFPIDLQSDSVCPTPQPCFENICLNAYKQSLVFARAGTSEQIPTTLEPPVYCKGGKGKITPHFNSQLLSFGSGNHSSNLEVVADPHPLPQTPATTCIIQAAFFELSESVALNFHPFKF